jgi:hypothetical protein
MKLKTGIMVLLVGIAMLGFVLIDAVAKEANCKIYGPSGGTNSDSGTDSATCELHDGTGDYKGKVWGEYGNGNDFGPEWHNCDILHTATGEYLDVDVGYSSHDVDGVCYY